MSSGDGSKGVDDSFALLIIDPQVDFHPGGALAVDGADKDTDRLHDFIMANLEHITNIYVTLDSHQRLHISHGLFWRDVDGNSPPPFTRITHADVMAGKWTAANPDLQEHATEYTRKLEATSRFQHFIWPEHCLIGSPGHCVVPPVLDAIHAWEARSRKPIHYICKGMNVLTEMYSVFKAEVPVDEDASTGLNVDLINRLTAEPRVYIAGQALSHCVNFSTRDLLDHWPAHRRADIVLLASMSSPVKAFEQQARDFIAFVRERGLTVVEK